MGNRLEAKGNGQEAKGHRQKAIGSVVNSVVRQVKQQKAKEPNAKSIFELWNIDQTGTANLTAHTKLHQIQYMSSLSMFGLHITD